MDSFKKQPRWIQVGLGLLVAILLIVIFSSLGGDDDDDDDREDSLGPSPVATAAQAQIPAQEPVQEPTSGALGESLTYEGVKITATALGRGESLLDQRYSCAAVEYENVGEDEVRLSPFDWKLQTPRGTVLNPSPFGSDNMLPYGEVAAGGSAQGDVCFEVDVKGAGQFMLIYEPSFWGDDRLTWAAP